MSFIKSSKFWSALALVASFAALLYIIWPMFAFRSGVEGVTFQSAGESLRFAIQVGAGVFAFSLITLFVGMKNKTSLIISSIACLLVLVPVAAGIALNPDQLNPPAAPQAAAGAAMGAAGAMGGAMGGGAMGGAGQTQALNDISTDTLDPPLFSAVAPLRPEGSNTLEYPDYGPQTQAQLFPDIAPIRSELSEVDAFARALDVAESMRWEIVAEDPNTGIIEAVATTLFFGFKDDVVIRVRPDESGSIVDIRSHSRVGRGDRGKNAERVTTFIEKF